MAKKKTVSPGATKAPTRKKVSVAKKKRREWTVTTFEELDAFRAKHAIPKKKMAELLEVTNSTYHNWARGIAVATPKTQQRIRRIIDAGAPLADGVSPEINTRPEVMEATGRIVESYLAAKPSGMTLEKLVELVREVRQALVH